VTVASATWFDTALRDAPLTGVGRAASGAVCDLDLAIVQTPEAFATLERDWTALFERAGSSAQVFQTFDWAWHWAEQFIETTTAEPQIAILTGRHNGVLVMLWPLLVEGRAGLRIVSAMGEPVSQYSDVLVEGTTQERTVRLQAGWHHMLATLKPDAVRFGKVRADSSLAELMIAVGARVTQQLEAPFLDLASAPTFAAYEERYSSKARKNRRRLARRLEEQGAVRFEHFAPGVDAERTVRAALAMKRAWLAEKGLVSPALADLRTLEFFTRVASDTSSVTGTRVSALTVDGAIAAVEIAFRCRERMVIHIMAYDLVFEKSAVGVLLLEYLLAKSHADGVGIYDLMAPGDGYKKEWADGAVAVCDYAVPHTLSGRVYVEGYLARARPALKAAVASVPLAWKRWAIARLSA